MIAPKIQFPIEFGLWIDTDLDAWKETESGLPPIEIYAQIGNSPELLTLDLADLIDDAVVKMINEPDQLDAAAKHLEFLAGKLRARKESK